MPTTEKKELIQQATLCRYYDLRTICAQFTESGLQLRHCSDALLVAGLDVMVPSHLHILVPKYLLHHHVINSQTVQRGCQPAAEMRASRATLEVYHPACIRGPRERRCVPPLASGTHRNDSTLAESRG
jgi:hypothetical protein